MQRTIDGPKGPDGIPVKFGKLTRRERADITRRLLADRRSKLEANLKAAAVDSETLFDRLDNWDFNEAAIGGQVFVTHANSFEGQSELMLIGLKKVKADATDDDIDAMELSDAAALKLTADICGLELQVSGPAADEGADGEAKKEPVPTSPLCYGDSTPTQTPTPTPNS